MGLARMYVLIRYEQACVGLPDMVILEQAYDSKLGDSNWNPNADIDHNGVVSLSNPVILAQHQGQHNP